MNISHEDYKIFMKKFKNTGHSLINWQQWGRNDLVSLDKLVSLWILTKKSISFRLWIIHKIPIFVWKKGLKNPFFSLKKIIISIYINKKVEGKKNGEV